MILCSTGLMLATLIPTFHLYTYVPFFLFFSLELQIVSFHGQRRTFEIRFSRRVVVPRISDEILNIHWNISLVRDFGLGLIRGFFFSFVARIRKLHEKKKKKRKIREKRDDIVEA